MSRIYLIRHGEITQLRPRRFVGQLDLPLTRTGCAQIQAVAQYLQDKGIARLLCSPLSRCVHGADIIGQVLGLSPELVPEMREISLGAWEGLTVDEVKSRFPGQYAARGQDLAGFCPQGGESFTDVQTRVWPVVEALMQEDNGAVAVVAHGGVNRAILCRVLGMPLANVFALGQDYGCVNIIEAHPAQIQVALLNHLP